MSNNRKLKCLELYFLITVSKLMIVFQLYVCILRYLFFNPVMPEIYLWGICSLFMSECLVTSTSNISVCAQVQTVVQFSSVHFLLFNVGNLSGRMANFEWRK